MKDRLSGLFSLPSSLALERGEQGSGGRKGREIVERRRKRKGKNSCKLGMVRDACNLSTFLG